MIERGRRRPLEKGTAAEAPVGDARLGKSASRALVGRPRPCPKTAAVPNDEILWAEMGSEPCPGTTSERLHQSYCGRRVRDMPRGNPSPKLAITVDSEVHRRVVAAAEDEGVSVSAWMTEAARRALLVRDGLAAVAEWERINGAFTDEEMLEARRRVATEVAVRRKRSA